LGCWGARVQCSVSSGALGPNTTPPSSALRSRRQGSGNDGANAVALDSLNTAYVVGSTDSADFPLAKPIAGQAVYHGATDGFVTAVDPVGAQLSYSTYLGGSDEDHAVAVAVAVQSIGGTTHVAGQAKAT
jgi:hypothetical protein